MTQINNITKSMVKFAYTEIKDVIQVKYNQDDGNIFIIVMENGE